MNQPPTLPNLTNPAEAAKHLIRLKRARESFAGFVELHHPTWTLAPFQRRLVNVLDRLERGALLNRAGKTVRRLLINWPPRHAKSTFATHLFVAYFIARKPHRKTITTAYNADLAKDFGGKVRDYIDHPFTKQAFSAQAVGVERALALDPSSTAKDFWRTTAGGQCLHTGIGGTTTGRPANLLLVDDPVKTRLEAESATYRNRVWSYYTGSLANRQEPDQDGQLPIEIAILTRWHPDDYGGRIMALDEWKAGDWMHLCEPAIQKTNTGVEMMVWDLPKTDPRYKPHTEAKNLSNAKRRVFLGEDVALWPERFPLEDLYRLQRLSRRDFESLYQQNPFIEGGNLIKLNWWRYYDTTIPPTDFQAVIITADTASKTKEMNDYSVLITMGLDRNGDIYVLEVLRGKWEFPDLKRLFILTNARWRGKNLRAIYVEDKSSGTPIIQELKRQSGMSVIEHKVAFDKVTRAMAVTPLIEGGRVFIPNEAPWLDDFLQECVEFGPNAKHDDQVDALVIGLDVLSRVPTSQEWGSHAPISTRGSLNQTGLAEGHGSLNSQMAWHRPAPLGG